ncbi:KRAB domain-containing zinc finger protein [Microdochium nivale]|nr:KRAB domain-containing zinc finger protein [Microdochium nivale]
MFPQESYVDESNQASNGSGRPEGFLNPLSAWYVENDGPWVLTETVAATENVLHGHTVQQSRAFMGYRETVPPSEPDTIINATLPSDSGYFSYTHRSIANASLCGESLDHATETGSIAGGLGGLMFEFPPLDIMRESPLEFSAHEWQSEPAPACIPKASTSESEWRCEGCNQILKTKSDMKKHLNRHTKPHRCLVLGCKRDEGFATANDLDRHVRSCHPEQPNTSPRYLCTLEKCAHKGKTWPRADNFRSHIKRVHKDVDLNDEQLEKFLYRIPAEHQDSSIHNVGASHEIAPENYWTVPQVTEYDISQNVAVETRYPGVAGRYQDGNSTPRGQNGPKLREHIASSNSTTPPCASNASERQIVSFGAVIEPAERLPSDQTSARSQELGEARTLPVHDHGTETLGADGDHNNLLRGVISHGTDKDVVAQDLEEEDLLAETEPMPLNVDLHDQDALRKLLDTLHKHGILSRHGYKKSMSHPTTDDESRPGLTISHTPESKPLFGCCRCGKSFLRRCELRKHEKRHEKPFGCTFLACTKRFGSKNDWKRHENSQHPLREMWKCDERHASNPSQICSNIDYQRDDFEQHLAKVHSISESDHVAVKLERCWIAKTYDERFWCGFCNEIVHTKSTGQVAGTERFDHIGDHYAGRHGKKPRNPDDWEHVDIGYINQSVPVADTDLDMKRAGSKRYSCSITNEYPVVSGKKRKRPQSVGNVDDS